MCSCVCIVLCLSHATTAPSISRATMSVESPLFAPPFTSARVQSRFEFVELGGDMCSNYRRRHWDYKQVPGWYYLVPRSIQG